MITKTATAALLALCFVSAAHAADGQPAHMDGPTPRWHVEVRDVVVGHMPDRFRPDAGRLVESLDVVQNGAVVHTGERIPYVDPDSVILRSDADRATPGMTRTKTLETGMAVSMDGPRSQPVLHVTDVSLDGFTTVMGGGTFAVLPVTHERAVHAPVPVDDAPVVAGGYTVEAKSSRVMRIFVVSRRP